MTDLVEGREVYIDMFNYCWSFRRVVADELLSKESTVI